MERLVTGSSHILVGECSSLLSVVLAHLVCHWMRRSPGVCFGSDIIPALRRPIGWHNEASQRVFSLLCRSRVFRVIFPGHAIRWKPVLCYVCNKLKLNGDKTEMLIFHAKHRPASFFDQVQAPRTSVTSSASSKNIGIVLDSTLSLNQHVTQICKSSFYSIRNISRIRKF